MALNIAGARPVVDIAIYNQEREKGTLGTSTAALVGPVPTGSRYVIDSIIFCEYAGSGSTITLRVVNSADSEGATNNILTTMAIAANETITFSIPIYLEAGDSLKGLAANATRVNYNVNYRTQA